MARRARVKVKVDDGGPEGGIQAKGLGILDVAAEELPGEDMASVSHTSSEDADSDAGGSGGGQYFLSPNSVAFTGSGCTLLDLVLGGGWAGGRICNIVGDRSTGKTLLAIEAIANFAAIHSSGKIWYREAEAAFDQSYAAALGMPLEKVEFSGESDFVTVEDIFEDLTKCIKATNANTPGMYVLDSLDALSDRAELARGIDEGTYGAAKAKKMSEMFRRLVRELGKANITVVIISQVRDNINPGFGGKAYSRSGGRALDFYASQVIYLAQTGKIYRSIKGEKRPVGVNIKARCEKNKIGMPYRECEFPLYFAYGTENLLANCTYLQKVKLLEKAGLSEAEMTKLPRKVLDMPEEDYRPMLELTNKLVRDHWCEVETSFMPKRRKYA